jgi:hypothetical protein
MTYVLFYHQLFGLGKPVSKPYEGNDIPLKICFGKGQETSEVDCGVFLGKQDQRYSDPKALNG